MEFWVLDDAKFLNILLDGVCLLLHDGVGLGAHERVDKFGCANQACYHRWKWRPGAG
jgi:hypothetical protein